MPRSLTLILFITLFFHIAVALLSHGGAIQDDAISYVALARNLIEGNGYVFEAGQPPTSWRAPGYPVFLATIWSLFGDSETVARIANAFLWAGTAFVSYKLAEITIGSEYGAPVALCVGLYPEFLGMTGLLWSESLYIFLFMALQWGIIALRHKSSIRLAIICGVLLGLAILTRSTTVIMVPLILGLALAGRQRIPLIPAMVVLLVGISVMGTWTIRNHLVHGSLVPVESNTGFNLFVGNRPDTPIPFAWTRVKTIRTDPEYIRLTEGKNEAERDHALKSAALAQMLDSPVRTVALGFSKLFDFWLPDFFIGMNVRAGSFGDRYRPFWQGILVVTVSAFLLFGISALCYIYKEWRAPHVQYMSCVLMLYTAPHVLVYGASRYHMPLMPLIIIMAVPTLVGLYQRCVEKQSRPRMAH